jgi:hypothetical protein
MTPRLLWLGWHLALAVLRLAALAAVVTAVVLLRTMWRTMCRGNPHGNRHHSRHLLNQEFIQALLLHFREHGKKAIEKVAREQPASYVKILALLVPREHKVEYSNSLKNMTSSLTLRLNWSNRCWRNAPPREPKSSAPRKLLHCRRQPSLSSPSGSVRTGCWST